MVQMDSPTPLYVQLADIIREEIRKGNLTQKVPSVRVLSERYGVAQVTVVRAMQLLKDEGLVVTVRGKGTYVKR